MSVQEFRGHKFRAILRLFCLDIEAKKVSELTSFSRVIVNKIFDKLRVVIALKCEAEGPCLPTVWPFSFREIELDESYFGAKRVRGKGGVVGQEEKYQFSGC